MTTTNSQQKAASFGSPPRAPANTTQKLMEVLKQLEAMSVEMQADLARQAFKALVQLKYADNWAKYASITVIVDGQPITTIGNILAEATRTDLRE